MSTPPPNVVIVGGSLAGLTVALACATRGLSVRVVERSARRVHGGDRATIDRDALAATVGHDTAFARTCRSCPPIAPGQMRYRSAEEQSVSIKGTGDAAMLVGRRVVAATIYGSRGSWNLQLSTDYRRRGDAWVATRMVASTF